MGHSSKILKEPGLVPDMPESNSHLTLRWDSNKNSWKFLKILSSRAQFSAFSRCSWNLRRIEMEVVKNEGQNAVLSGKNPEVTNWAKLKNRMVQVQDGVYTSN